jgi:hypothetical protein
MRAIGHFIIFISFFLVFAVLLAALVLGAAALRSTTAMLLLLPALPGLYLIYSRGYRAIIQRTGSTDRPTT